MIESISINWRQGHPRFWSITPISARATLVTSFCFYTQEVHELNRRSCYVLWWRRINRTSCESFPSRRYSTVPSRWKSRDVWVELFTRLSSAEVVSIQLTSSGFFLSSATSSPFLRWWRARLSRWTATSGEITSGRVCGRSRRLCTSR